MLRLTHGVAIIGGLVVLLGFFAFAQPHLCVYPHSCVAMPMDVRILLYLGPGLLVLLLAWAIALSIAIRSDRWKWLRSSSIATVLSVATFFGTLLLLAPRLPAHPELSLGLLLVALWWTYSIVTTRFV